MDDRVQLLFLNLLPRVSCWQTYPRCFRSMAIAVMGKDGFNTIKGKVFAFFKRHAPPKEVSRSTAYLEEPGVDSLASFTRPWLGTNSAMTPRWSDTGSGNTL